MSNRNRPPEQHRALTNQFHLLATFCDIHKFEGVDVMYGLKVGRLIDWYGSDRNWLWSRIEKMAPGVQRDKLQPFAPAVFLWGVQCNLQQGNGEEAMDKCNEQLLHNCIACAKLHYGRFGIKRYLCIRLAKKLYNQVRQSCLGLCGGDE